MNNDLNKLEEIKEVNTPLNNIAGIPEMKESGDFDENPFKPQAKPNLQGVAEMDEQSE